MKVDTADPAEEWTLVVYASTGFDWVTFFLGEVYYSLWESVFPGARLGRYLGRAKLRKKVMKLNNFIYR